MLKPKFLLMILLVGLVGASSCSSRDEGRLRGLSDYTEWANTREEFPQPDNADLFNPNYESYHRSLNPGFLASTYNYVLSLFSNQNPVWLPGQFSSYLSKLVSQREKAGLGRKHFLAIRPSPGAQFFVWGDLQGAFHSLLRDLTELKLRGIIDDGLKIKNADTYFVFNGNQIDRSAYNLETLTVIFTLMLVNDGKVIYIAGDHEIGDIWRDYGLGREIEARTSDRKVKDKSQKLQARLVSSFFKTLPENMVVLDSKEVPDELDGLKNYGLKIYAGERQNLETENKHAKLLAKIPREIPLAIFSDSPPASDQIKLKIDATLHTVDRSMLYLRSEGLDPANPDRGAVAWTSLSSPTFAFRKTFKYSNDTFPQFSNDAFVLISINNRIANSTISLIRQNAFEKKGFEQDNYHLMTGKRLTQEEMKSPAAIEDYDVSVGSTFDLSGTSGILGRRVLNGIGLRVRKQNREKGGIDGKLLRFYAMDDRSSSSTTLQNVQILAENYGVRTLVIPEGIATTEALAPEVEEKRLNVFFPNSGSSSIRKSEMKNLINLRTSFSNEACALVNHSLLKLHKKKIAIVYQNDSFGKEALAAATNLLEKKYKIPKDKYCQIAYEADSLNMEKPAKLVETCLPDAIIFLSTFAAAESMIQSIGLPFLARTTILGLSSVTDAIRNGSGLRIIISRVVPDPNDKNPLEVVKNYRREMDIAYPGASYNADSLEAYIGSSLLVHAVADEKSGIKPPITVEKLMNHLEKMPGHQGLKFRFNPKTRELLNELWLDTGDGPWIHLEQADKLCQ